MTWEDIEALAWTDPIVSACLRLDAPREELLCRMVVELSREKERLLEALVTRETLRIPVIIIGK
jgi:hypothetical protein